MDTLGTSQNLRPLSLLNESSDYDSIHLQVFSNSVSWSIYLEQGKIIYASHSVEPFDRLDCQLRRLLKNQTTAFISEVRTQLRKIRLEYESQSTSRVLADYEAILWLVRQQYLTSKQASFLIEELVKEVIESFLLLKKGTYKLGNKLDIAPIFCKLEVKLIVEYCQNQIDSWQALEPHIWSPYQRPYFPSQNKVKEHLSPDIRQKLSVILKEGFSFYHLAILLHQDKFQLAQSLHPYIEDGTVLLYDPSPPFNQLPRTSWQLSKNSISVVENTSLRLRENSSKGGLVSKLQTPIRNANSTKTVVFGGTYSPASLVDKPTHKIVCVDDSQTVLSQISYFLDGENFSVFPVNNPVKALMQIVRVKPDLILLDIGMAELDGYELCRLLRNHSLFKVTPIIMVTGNTSVVDRVRARIVGASGYLAKPFNKVNLLKTMFKHLV